MFVGRSFFCTQVYSFDCLSKNQIFSNTVAFCTDDSTRRDSYLSKHWKSYIFSSPSLSVQKQCTLYFHFRKIECTKYLLPDGNSTPHAQAHTFSHSFLMSDEVISSWVSVLLTRANMTREKIVQSPNTLCLLGKVSVSQHCIKYET